MGVRVKRFTGSLSFFQLNPVMRTELVLDNYDWAKYKMVVDVGGSFGDVAFELANAFQMSTAYSKIYLRSLL